MKFSVIVPIYKVEEYLCECVDSVLNQTYTDFELILVDDGSPDNCGKICDAYARDDNRIKVIHKENGGLVSARQAGIEASCGDYIVNVDADDYIDKDMLKNSMDIINKHSPDVIYFAMTNFNSHKEWLFDECVAEGFYDEDAIKEKIYPCILMNDRMKNINYLITVKVAKKELIKPIQLSVSKTINLGEDLACSAPLLSSAKSIYVSRLAMYNYRHRDTSISKRFKSSWFDNIYECAKRVEKMCSDVPDIEEQINRYLMFITFAILNIIADTKAYEQVDEVDRKIKEFGFDERFKTVSFNNITPKSRISYILMRKGKFKLTYRFLSLCKLMKK